MNFIFKGGIVQEDHRYFITIPFNVWEVSVEKSEDVSVEVTVDGLKFETPLISDGRGYFSIPVPEEIQMKLPDTKELNVSFQLKEVMNIFQDENVSAFDDVPVGRKIEQIHLVKQPWDGLCGQACVAMLANVSLQKACEIMKCREWQGNMGKVIQTLDYLKIPHADKLIYTGGSSVELPKLAIILEKMGRFAHYLIHFDGKYFDMNEGVLEHLNHENILGYLEIHQE